MKRLSQIFLAGTGAVCLVACGSGAAEQAEADGGGSAYNEAAQETPPGNASSEGPVCSPDDRLNLQAIRADQANRVSLLALQALPSKFPLPAVRGDESSYIASVSREDLKAAGFQLQDAGSRYLLFVTHGTFPSDQAAINLPPEASSVVYSWQIAVLDGDTRMFVTGKTLQSNCVTA